MNRAIKYSPYKDRMTIWKSYLVRNDKRKHAWLNRLTSLWLHRISWGHGIQLRSSLSSSETRLISFSWLLRSELLNGHTLCDGSSLYQLPFLIAQQLNQMTVSGQDFNKFFLIQFIITVFVQHFEYFIHFFLISRDSVMSKIDAKNCPF